MLNCLTTRSILCYGLCNNLSRNKLFTVIRPRVNHMILVRLAKSSSGGTGAGSSGNNADKKSKVNELNAQFVTNDPRMPPRQRLKNLFTVYGPTAVVLHIVLSLSFLGITYLVVAYGFDVPAFLSERNLMNEKYMTIVANGGTFGLAYAIYKAMMPARALVTLALTPKVARTLQQYGIIKRPF